MPPMFQLPLTCCCFLCSIEPNPEFHAGNTHFSLSPCPPLLAELQRELNLQASQLFQTLRSTEVETCEESGWLTHHSPTIHSLHLCYLLRGRRGRRRPGCLDEVITAYQWHWGGRPADLWCDTSWAKSRGTLLTGCAKWLILGRSGRVQH